MFKEITFELITLNDKFRLAITHFCSLIELTHLFILLLFSVKVGKYLFIICFLDNYKFLICFIKRKSDNSNFLTEFRNY